jgi:post-segregation antitoxin (ccd killing protein)
MARVNVYLPDRLAEEIRADGVNLSNLTRVAAERELTRRSTTSWLRRVALQRAAARLTHEVVFDVPAPASWSPSHIAGGLRAGPGPGPGPGPGTSHVVVDASAVLDLMFSIDMGPLVESTVSGCVLHAPANIDAQVLAVLGRLDDEGLLGGRASEHAETLADAPIERHSLAALVAGAWRWSGGARGHGRGRDRGRATLDVDRAFYVELATSLPARLVTTAAGPLFAPAVSGSA